ncbi:GNVR domain-containing protein [Siphonobacter curvatus]|uniref:Lipopolysaccharide biosynthesis protein n=1 Tax=Siphonobacter curvatus TaxID=2094562 RepID=A0A2S7IKN4_9BACT|nr:GNVR domain-containing protein [Siphonobacter curvatus]PQA58311.1 lipopolysaccharide biosynthesis protein [Siphonobacter curvatus]
MEAKEVFQNSKYDSSSVIYFADIIKFLRKKYKLILFNGIVFGILGAIYSFSLQSEYAANTKILPELQSKSSLGSFRALADLAGINLDNMQISEAIRPDLYPSVLQSKPFLLNLSQLKVKASSSNKSETVEQFLRRQEDSFLFKTLISRFQRTNNIDSARDTKLIHLENNFQNQIIVLNQQQEKLLKDLSKRVKVELDKKTGIIIIETTMPDPVVAALTTHYTTDYLTNYILDYRSAKQSEQAKFLIAQKEAAKKRFQKAEQNLRAYQDRNRNPFLTSVTSDASQLQSELSIAQNLYIELSRQAEQAQIKIREELPILKVLEPAQVPLKRSSPIRSLIVIQFMILGIIIGLIVAILKK